MDENHPSFDVQDRRFDEKDPAFDENHSELNGFISGPGSALPHFEELTPNLGSGSEGLPRLARFVLKGVISARF
jgi:hypothetical protein